jgi:hypothetical protein
MITFVWFILLSFLIELFRWGTAVTWTLTQHYFWDYLIANYSIVSVCYIVAVVCFFKLNLRKRQKIVYRYVDNSL